MPFRQLFTKREQRLYSGMGKDLLMEKSAAFWCQSQFSVGYPGPMQIHAEHVQMKIGLRQVVDVRASDLGGSVSVDMLFSAMLGDEEAVIGAVGAVIVFPVAAAIGAVSYLEYENDAANLMRSFWGYLDSLVISSGGRIAYAPIQPSSTSVPALNCARCGLPLDSDAGFCKRCGEKIPGR